MVIDAERFRRIDRAFKSGDLEALRAAVEDPALVPNGYLGLGIGSCLVYAVYHSPLAFVRQLLESGANPNEPVDDGFPPIIAALSSRAPSPARADERTSTTSFGSCSRSVPIRTSAALTTTHRCTWPSPRATFQQSAYCSTEAPTRRFVRASTTTKPPWNWPSVPVMRGSPRCWIRRDSQLPGAFAQV